MGSYVGKDAKVSLGTDKISLLGNWTIQGITTDLLDDSEFGDEFKTQVPGMKDGGTISFSGLYDGTDTTGQTALRNANAANTSVTTLRLYVNDTSYWTFTTTNPLSYGWVTDWSIGADMNALLTADFSIKVSGKLELI